MFQQFHYLYICKRIESKNSNKCLYTHVQVLSILDWRDQRRLASWTCRPRLRIGLQMDTIKTSIIFGPGSSFPETTSLVPRLENTHFPLTPIWTPGIPTDTDLLVVYLCNIFMPRGFPESWRQTVWNTHLQLETERKPKAGYWWTNFLG